MPGIGCLEQGAGSVCILARGMEGHLREGHPSPINLLFSCLILYKLFFLEDLDYRGHRSLRQLTRGGREGGMGLDQ